MTNKIGFIFAFLLLSSLSSLASFASEPLVTYYMGDVRISNPDGTPAVQNFAVMFLQKTYDQDHNLAIERGVEVNSDGSVIDGTSTFAVTGNNFTVSDPKGVETGSGVFTGSPWQWTYFKATYFMKMNARDATGKVILDPQTQQPIVNIIQIDDENTFVDPSVVTGRHTFSMGGEAFQYWDLSLRQISQSSFDLLTGTIIKNAKNYYKD